MDYIEDDLSLYNIQIESDVYDTDYDDLNEDFNVQSDDDIIFE